ERDQLVQLREPAGRILETARHAARAIGERLPHDADHALQLRRRRPAVRVADDVSAHGAEPDHRRKVDGYAVALERAEELADRARILAWRDGAAVLSRDFRRHPLPQLAFRYRIAQQPRVRVRVDVDEAGRDGEPAHVDLGGTGACRAALDRD